MPSEDREQDVMLGRLDERLKGLADMISRLEQEIVKKTDHESLERRVSRLESGGWLVISTILVSIIGAVLYNIGIQTGP